MDEFLRQKAFYHRLAFVPPGGELLMLVGIRVLYLEVLGVLLVPITLVLLIASVMIAGWGIVLIFKAQKFRQPLLGLIGSTLLASVNAVGFVGFFVYVSVVDAGAASFHNR